MWPGSCPNSQAVSLPICCSPNCPTCSFWPHWRRWLSLRIPMSRRPTIRSLSCGTNSMCMGRPSAPLLCWSRGFWGWGSLRKRGTKSMNIYGQNMGNWGILACSKSGKLRPLLNAMMTFHSVPSFLREAELLLPVAPKVRVNSISVLRRGATTKWWKSLLIAKTIVLNPETWLILEQEAVDRRSCTKWQRKSH